jgi:hypothetical protein
MRLSPRLDFKVKNTFIDKITNCGDESPLANVGRFKSAPATPLGHQLLLSAEVFAEFDETPPRPSEQANDADQYDSDDDDSSCPQVSPHSSTRPSVVSTATGGSSETEWATESDFDTVTDWGSEPGTPIQWRNPWIQLSGTAANSAPTPIAAVPATTTTTCITGTTTNTSPAAEEDLEKYLQKWERLAAWCLRRPRQHAVREALVTQLEGLGAGQSDTAPEYLKKLAATPEQQWSLGTIACFKGKCGETCMGCWKVPRHSGEEGQRRENRVCFQGILCKFCHCHPAGKPNQKRRNQHGRRKDSGSSTSS